MKILLISTVVLTTPPTNYGGAERVVYEYARGLAKLGHEVSLAASRESKAPEGVYLIDTVHSWDKLRPEDQQRYGKADRMWNGWRAHEENAFNLYKELVGSFDVIGDHSWAKWSYMTPKQEIIGSCHSVQPYNIPPRPQPCFTGTSRGHAQRLSQVLGGNVGILYNPTDLSLYDFQPKKEGAILSLARIMPQKGIHLFLKLAKENKWEYSDVVGDDSKLVGDQGYVQFIREKCKETNANYYGLVDDDVRIELLQNAKCLVCLKDYGFEEIFGLNIVEAMACGTPVVSINTWGANDIIEHGKSGFIAQTIEEIPKYVEKIGEIKAEDCRERAKVFSTETLSPIYAKLFEQVKSGIKW